MKSLVLTFVFVVAGVVLGFAAFQPVHAAPQPTQVVIPPVEKGDSIPAPEAPTVINVAPITIVGYVHKHTPARPKTYGCGEWHTMQMGPIGAKVQECEWK
jgi:hypothetical protein